MTRPGNERWTLAAGLTLSLAVHLGAAASFGLFSPAGRGEEAFIDRPEPIDPDAITPGVDRSTATTINWIGFEDQTEHQAREATTDQPALARGVPAESAPRLPVMPLPPAQPVPIPLTEAARGDLPERSDRLDAVDELLSRLEAASPPRPDPAESAEPTKPAEPTEPTAEPASKPANPAPPEPTGGPSESDPTARVKPTEIRPGRPVAMEGVTIDTVAPRFTAVTRLTSSPRNPLVRLTFNTRGEVVTAELLEPSGVKNVDGPVLDAMYQWRAKGDRLGEIRDRDGEDATFALDFRIVLR